MNNETALVVFSGGQDSTTCLFWAKKHFKKVYALSFIYGQKHVKEVELAREIARKADVEFAVMDVSFIGHLGKNSLTDTSIHMDEEKPADSFPNTFVPGRNLVFLTYAAARAYLIKAQAIVAGMGQTDFSGYPDCRRDTMDALQKALSLGLDQGIEIVTPLMFLSKAQTWALAEKLGGEALVHFIVENTHTCYEGDHQHHHDWGYGCGQCPACLLREKGWQEYLTNSKH